jgi:hypothetical protein
MNNINYKHKYNKYKFKYDNIIAYKNNYFNLTNTHFLNLKNYSTPQKYNYKKYYKKYKKKYKQLKGGNLTFKNTNKWMNPKYKYHDRGKLLTNSFNLLDTLKNYLKPKPDIYSNELLIQKELTWRILPEREKSISYFINVIQNITINNNKCDDQTKKKMYIMASGASGFVVKIVCNEQTYITKILYPFDQEFQEYYGHVINGEIYILNKFINFDHPTILKYYGYIDTYNKIDTTNNDLFENVNIKQPEYDAHLFFSFYEYVDFNLEFIKNEIDKIRNLKQRKSIFYRLYNSEHKIYNLNNWLLLYFYNALLGLQYFHSKNTFHRDIKPANLMFKLQKPKLMELYNDNILKITGWLYGIPKIIDYGEAMFNDNNNEENSDDDEEKEEEVEVDNDDNKCLMNITGTTPNYTPPEIKHTRQYCYKSELFVLALSILYIISNDYNNYDKDTIQIDIQNIEIIDSFFKDILAKCLKEDMTYRPSINACIDLIYNYFIDKQLFEQTKPKDYNQDLKKYV